MNVVTCTEQHLDQCAELWWSIYRDRPYVHRPDGGQTINGDPIGPETMVKWLGHASGGSSHYKHCTGDDILLAEHNGRIIGILVAPIDPDTGNGCILSGYVPWTGSGGETAALLVDEALARFRDRQIEQTVAAPDLWRSMEVESPLHLALLDAGFAWRDAWEVKTDPDGPVTVPGAETYGVFLGGWHEDFVLSPQIEQRITRLAGQGIEIKRIEPVDCAVVRRLDTRGPVQTLDGPDEICAFIAFVDDLAVGWTFEVSLYEDEGRTMCQVGPEVIPSYRGRGIGKAPHHLGMAKAVAHGAQCSSRGTGVHNPARMIYASVPGYRYWYTAYSRFWKRLMT